MVPEQTFFFIGFAMQSSIAMHTDIPDFSNSQLAKRLYWATFLTAIFALCSALWAAVHDYTMRNKPHVARIITSALFIVTALFSLPYLWPKAIARLKVFVYLFGWTLVLVAQLAATAHGS